MDEIEQTTTRTTEHRDRRAEIIRLAKRRALLLAIMMLPALAILAWAIGRDASIPKTVAWVVAMALVLVLALLLFIVFVVLQGLHMWFGWDEWIERLHKERLKKRLSAVFDAPPFQTEQRCKLSPTEEVWVRHTRKPQGHGALFLEVFYSKNSGQSWQTLPLRLSPWARFKCIMLDGEWPPTSASRNLFCDSNCISFEVAGADCWDNWDDVWRATYHPRRKWWTLKVVGGASSERLLRGR
jgi:hypothetical protein